MSRPSPGFPILKALVFLLILVSVSLLGNRMFTRIDLTENREYTLNVATKNVLDRLDDVVNVKVYFSEDLPPYMVTLDRQVKDLLDEYENHSGGNLSVEFIDPGGDPVLEQTMQQMGIPKLQLTRYEKERAEAMSAYLGIAIQFEDQTEVIPVVQTVERLEYDITAALIKVSEERKTVAIAAAGSFTVPEGFDGLQELLRQQYTPQVIDVNSDPIPATATTVVVIDSDAFTDEGLYRIDQFVMGGGRAFFMVPGVNVDLTTLQAQNRSSKIAGMLRTYGVEVQSRMIVDAQAPMVGFDVGSFFPLSLRYPWFPQVVAEGFSRESPITSELQALVLPWTSPLATTAVDSSAGARATFEVLARSSERSFAHNAPYNLNPQNRLALPQTGVGPQPLAIAAQGRFPSHWRGQPVPGDSLGTAPPVIDISPETQIVVVGSSNFANNQFLQQFNPNVVFLANTLDWMTLGNDLISIRSRGAMTRPLKEIEDNRRSLLKALAMFPVPILVVVLGLIRAQMRKNKRLRFSREFGGAS